MGAAATNGIPSGGNPVSSINKQGPALGGKGGGTSTPAQIQLPQHIQQTLAGMLQGAMPQNQKPNGFNQNGFNPYMQNQQQQQYQQQHSSQMPSSPLTSASKTQPQMLTAAGIGSLNLNNIIK